MSGQEKGARRSSRTDPGAESNRPPADPRIDTAAEVWAKYRARGFQIVPVGPPFGPPSPRIFAVLSPDGEIAVQGRGAEDALRAFLRLVEILTAPDPTPPGVAG